MRMRTKMIGLLFVVIFLVSAVTGCVSEDTTAEEKVLNVGTNLFNKSLDPHKDYDGWYTIRYGVAETLVRMSDNMEVEPWLATQWDMVDELTWNITIREGVKFHNGRDMTPEAVKNSLLRSMELNSRAVGNLKIESITVDGQDLIIKTIETRPDLIYELCDPYTSIVDVAAAEEDPESFVLNPVCTGAFMWKEFVNDISVTVAAFEDYWGGRAKLDQVKFLYLNDADTRLMSLQSGDIDATINIDSSNLSLFENNSQYTISRSPSMRCTYIMFNSKNEFLEDENLRIALIMSADKENYIKSVMGGVGVVGVGLYPTILPFGSEDLVLPAFDRDGAKKLLAESGYEDTNGDEYLEKNGKTVELVISAYTSRAEIPGFATGLQSDFTKIGIKTNIKTYDTLPREEFTAGDYDIAFTSFSPTTNGRPIQGFRTAFLKDSIENYDNYFYSEELEEIVKKMAVESDVARQNEMAARAQQIILDAHKNIFIAYTENLYVSSSKVTGFDAHPIDYYVLNNQVDIQ